MKDKTNYWYVVYSDQLGVRHVGRWGKKPLHIPEVGHIEFGYVCLHLCSLFVLDESELFEFIGGALQQMGKARGQ